MTQDKPIQSDQQKDNQVVINVWGIAGEIGLIIAVPLVILLLIGIKLDKTLGTTPLFIVISMVLSLVASTLAIARKIRRIDSLSK